MTEDPICGMKVNEATALRAEHAGETFYFCSEHCRKKFIGQPLPAKAIPLTSTETGDECCGAAKAEPSSGSGDCCSGTGGHEDHASHGHEHKDKHGTEEHSCCGGKAGAAALGDGHHDHSLHHRGDAALTPSAAAKYFCPTCPGMESD